MSMTSHWFCEECQWHPSTQKFFPGWFCDECQWRRADFVRNANDIRHKKYHSRAVLWWMSMTSGWFCEECQWHPSQKILRGWFADECQWRLADFVRNANDIRHKNTIRGWFRDECQWLQVDFVKCHWHPSQRKIIQGPFCDECQWRQADFVRNANDIRHNKNSSQGGFVMNANDCRQKTYYCRALFRGSICDECQDFHHKMQLQWM